MIELDVHLTRDGVPVVCHDATIDRTTDGCGAIRDMTVAELRAYDAGVRFVREFAGERIPLLVEALELIPPHIEVIIELKHGWNGRLEEHVLRCVRDRDRMRSVLFTSFDHRMLYRLKRTTPEARIGLVYMAALLDPVRLVRDFGEKVEAVSVCGALTNRDEITRFRAEGWRVIVWTLNKPDEILQASEAGADGIVTDVPGLARQLLG